MPGLNPGIGGSRFLMQSSCPCDVQRGKVALELSHARLQLDGSLEMTDCIWKLPSLLVNVCKQMIAHRHFAIAGLAIK